MTTNIQKWGIPKAILDSARISIDDNVSVDVSDGKIVITKTTKRYDSLKELFAARGFTGKVVAEEVDWGASVGDEVW